MSLKYGLNIKKKAAPVPARRTLLDDDDEEEDDDQSGRDGNAAIDSITTFDNSKPSATSRPSKVNKLRGSPPPSKRIQDERQDISSVQASRAQVKAAEDVDASIFDYDSFHDAKSMANDAKQAAARQDAIDRKPKYINNLLDAAARRKQDQTIAKEKLLQREREAEGDEFADKEKFVTGAYKQQQEETRRLEEEEKKRAEAEEDRRRRMGGGMQSFYRGMIDEQEKQHQEAVEAAAKFEGEGGLKSYEKEREKTDVELAAEMRAKGVNVHLNDEGLVTDKRELLSAGLNVAPSGRSKDSRPSDSSRLAARPAESLSQARNGAGKQAQRERQSRMMEDQLAEKAKRAREEEAEERVRLENAAKSTKTDKDVSDAKARYLARKAAKEKGEG